MLHNADLDQLIDTILLEMRSFDRILVAFSGGVDSACVAALAHRALCDNAAAAIAVSETLPARELLQAHSVANDIGIPLHEVDFSELANNDFVANTSARCYFCQTMRFEQLSAMAAKLGFATIASGTNADDVHEDRPGLLAMRQQGVYQPLLRHNVDKATVRAIAKLLGLSIWNKPAAACLSSRIPHGITVTSERLQQIEVAEAALADLGFRQFRVRSHGPLARLEFDHDGLDRITRDAALRAAVRNVVVEAGFPIVAVDAQGYHRAKK